jgi:hypothetical protein
MPVQVRCYAGAAVGRAAIFLLRRNTERFPGHRYIPWPFRKGTRNDARLLVITSVPDRRARGRASRGGGAGIRSAHKPSRAPIPARSIRNKYPTRGRYSRSRPSGCKAYGHRGRSPPRPSTASPSHNLSATRSNRRRQVSTAGRPACGRAALCRFPLRAVTGQKGRFLGSVKSVVSAMRFSLRLEVQRRTSLGGCSFPG